jgi:hypothetical protein
MYEFHIQQLEKNASQETEIGKDIDECPRRRDELGSDRSVTS